MEPTKQQIMEKLGEEVARELHKTHKKNCKRMFSWDMRDTTWEELDSQARHHYRSASDQIQEIYKKYCSLNAERELPHNCPAPSIINLGTQSEGERFGYYKAIGEMLQPDSEGRVFKSVYKDWK